MALEEGDRLESSDSGMERASPVRNVWHAWPRTKQGKAPINRVRGEVGGEVAAQASQDQEVPDHQLLKLPNHQLLERTFHHPHRLRLVPKMTMPSAKSAIRQRVNAGSHVTFATTGTI